MLRSGSPPTSAWGPALDHTCSRATDGNHRGQHRPLRLTVGRFPLWLRWVLTLLTFGAIAIIAALVLRGPGNSPQGDAAALLRANRAARLVVTQDQAPHSSALARGVAPSIALERAIAADIRGRVRRHQLGGPAQGVRCAAIRAGRVARPPFRCTAGAGGIGYPYVGVVDLRARRLTWCKFDPAPPDQVVPLSPRCGG